MKTITMPVLSFICYMIACLFLGFALFDAINDNEKKYNKTQTDIQDLESRIQVIESGCRVELTNL